MTYMLTGMCSTCYILVTWNMSHVIICCKKLRRSNSWGQIEWSFLNSNDCILTCQTIQWAQCFWDGEVCVVRLKGTRCTKARNWQLIEAWTTLDRRSGFLSWFATRVAETTLLFAWAEFGYFVLNQGDAGFFEKPEFSVLFTEGRFYFCLEFYTNSCILVSM